MQDITSCWRERPDIGLTPEHLKRFKGYVRIGVTCWIWQKRLDSNGYSHMSVHNRVVRAHRLSVFFSGRDIPKDKNVDHLCRNRACVRPDHLEVVTPRENVLRAANTASGKNMRKTHCVNGHEFVPENIYDRKDLKYPTRQCRECQRIRYRKYRDRDKNG